MAIGIENPGNPVEKPWPERPRRLALAVSDDLVDRIVGGQFPTGSALPNEATLCEHYRASRTVIREALQSAEALGLVRAQQGQGTIVRPFEDWDLLNPVVLAATVRHDAELAILDDLIDMRCALESQMAAHAAIRASAEDAEALRALYEATVSAADDPVAHLRADLAFHDGVARVSGNRLSRVADAKISAEASRSIRYLGETTPNDCREANVGHAVIVDCIAAGDPDGAARAMNEHIFSSWMRRRPSKPTNPRLEEFRRRHC